MSFPVEAIRREGERPSLRPLAIDLFCGLGGWTEGLIAEGYDVIGFDIERHQYGEHRYPATLVIQDVTTLHGSQFKGAALIVASPPCQGYSYRAMPWSRARALPPPDNTLFETCFRIQREASEAAGHHVPMIVENVRGAQKWVGRARWNYGSFYLWGDVPALMPIIYRGSARLKTAVGEQWNVNRKNFTGTQAGWSGEHRDEHVKVSGQDWNRFRQTGEVSAHWRMEAEGVKQRGSGREWFAGDGKISRMTSSNSPARKMASAMIAKIPLPLSRYLAATFKREVLL